MYFSLDPSAQVEAQGLPRPVPAMDMSSSRLGSGFGQGSHGVAAIPWSDDENSMHVVLAPQSLDQAFDALETTWTEPDWRGIPTSTVPPPSATLQGSSPRSVNRSGSGSAVPSALPSDKATEELKARAKLERRRAQNRVSQQAFRARKESHIKALEKQLEALKNEHERMLKDFARRQAEIDRLKARIAELGVEIFMNHLRDKNHGEASGSLTSRQQECG
ncbi:hypothetical protein CLAIMM_08132 [Cladophialophora immunda]|nr:hypothetical protein CLAIMM_08132 [Cladophialophora immunda]